MNFVVVLDESFHSGLCFCRMKRRKIHSYTWEAHINTIRTSRQSTTVKKTNPIQWGRRHIYST